MLSTKHLVPLLTLGLTLSLTSSVQAQSYAAIGWTSQSVENAPKKYTLYAQHTIDSPSDTTLSESYWVNLRLPTVKLPIPKVIDKGVEKHIIKNNNESERNHSFNTEHRPISKPNEDGDWYVTFALHLNRPWKLPSYSARAIVIFP